MTRFHWTLRLTLPLLFAIVSAAPTGRAALADGYDEPVVHHFNLATHIEAGFPEQEVHIQRGDDPDLVYRFSADDLEDEAVLDMPLYASAEEADPDPFQLGEHPLGPFPKGAALGFTVGGWLEASGGGTYTVDGDHARLALAMENLVPGGLYTVWCVRAMLPPTPMLEEYPCGAPDGSDNAFTAGDDGSGSFAVALEPLEESNDTAVSVIAVAYHSDDQSHGDDPGPNGVYTHGHLLHVLPAPDAHDADMDAPGAMPTTGAGDFGFGLLLALALAGAAGVGALWQRRLEAQRG